VRPITKKISKKVPTKKKEADDVIGENAWKSAQRTTGLSFHPLSCSLCCATGKLTVLLPARAVTCEKCGNKEAYFMQIQIRSADEPMTTFYRCTNFNCAFQWREG